MQRNGVVRVNPGNRKQIAEVVYSGKAYSSDVTYLRLLQRKYTNEDNNLYVLKDEFLATSVGIIVRHGAPYSKLFSKTYVGVINYSGELGRLVDKARVAP